MYTTREDFCSTFTIIGHLGPQDNGRRQDNRANLPHVWLCVYPALLSSGYLDTARGAPQYLKPEVVFSLVRDFSVIIADVTLPNQAVDGPLIWVGAVPQHTAVVEAKFVL